MIASASLGSTGTTVRLHGRTKGVAVRIFNNRFLPRSDVPGGGGGAAVEETTVDELPDASANANALFFVTDASWPGPCVVISTGTDWLRLDNSAVVRAHSDVEIYSLDIGANITTDWAAEAADWFVASYERDVPWAMEVIFRPDVGAAGALIGYMASGGQGFELAYLADGRLDMRLRVVTTSNELRVLSTEFYAVDVWHRALVIYDGLGDASGLSIIADGVLSVPNVISNTLSSDYMTFAGQDWCIGGRLPLGPAQQFEGDIHRVRLWSGVSWTVAQAITASTVYPNRGQGRLDNHYRMGNGWDSRTSVGTLNNYAAAGNGYFAAAGFTSTTMSMQSRGTRIEAAP